MSNFFPTDPKKIRERLKRYERAFKEPHHDDGAGKRFMIGQLYMLMGDVEGAVKSYAWYRRSFPDDVPEAFNHLCWTLALLRSGNERDAKNKFREMVFANLYIVPMFLGQAPAQHGFKHYSNWSEAAYIQEGPTEEIFGLWTTTESAWLKNEWESPDLQIDIRKYIDLQTKLENTDGSDERGRVIAEAARVARGQHLRLVDAR